ncbi:MAG: hypothetical protein AAF601_03815 [Pseudomonadota bacterium]
MVHHLTVSNLTKIADFYSYPAAVYFDDNVIVLRSRDELLHAVRIYRGILAKCRLARIKTRVVDAPGIYRDRFTVTVCNRYFDLDERDIGASRIQFYVQREGTCAKIRLAEYLKWPCGKELEADAELQKLCVKRPMSRSRWDGYRAPDTLPH